MLTKTVHIRLLGLQPYAASWEAMKQFTEKRDAETIDEIWFLEHHPVFTQGQNGKAEHLLNPSSIPVVKTDRGGQITYHGPGQLMIYTLIDLKRKQFHVRQLVSLLEGAIISFLRELQIEAIAKQDAPGIYIDQKKICSIGLRIRKGCAYHGLAFNILMDLKPFTQINPCGFAKLQMTQLADFSCINEVVTATRKLIPHFMSQLDYTKTLFVD